ncbi:histidine kinase dimerization/phospho-acceptor domain-containing protein [Arenimonas daejeonensis]|uniref:ATP-binding protein n=1 Tax=Arenimonas daejeonensis TaxID=370777 RepID=UPI0011BFDC5A|nr:histidine kinase dimerization/phospho-acceptor domain-containing protein [Arenimonas daejeonensis]
MFRRPLRNRIALTCGVIGFVLSLCFAVATTIVAEEYEHIVIQAVLDGQAREVMEQLRSDPQAVLVNSEHFSSYRQSDAPEIFRALPNGLHEVEAEGRDGLHAAVYGEGSDRWVFAIEVGPIEILERYLARAMFVIVICGSLLAGWLGWLLANRAIQPVVHLADRVSALPARPVATNMAEDFIANDEIRRLASSIDGYQQRLVEVDAAEKVFFSNASHELRTPIAVIQGAVEVLCDDPAMTSGQRVRIGRIDRAILELGWLLEALLLSARGVPADSEQIDIAATIEEALARIVAVEPDAARRITLDLRSPLTVTAPRRWTDCILSVLLQRVLNKAPGTAWQVVVTDAGLDVLQPDNGQVAGDRVQRSDLGLNLMFVDRLCRGLGWRLEQRISEQGALTLHLGIR